MSLGARAVPLQEALRPPGTLRFPGPAAVPPETLNNTQVLKHTLEIPTRWGGRGPRNLYFGKRPRLSLSNALGLQARPWIQASSLYLPVPALDHRSPSLCLNTSCDRELIAAEFTGTCWRTFRMLKVPSYPEPKVGLRLLPLIHTPPTGPAATPLPLPPESPAPLPSLSPSPARSQDSQRETARHVGWPTPP